MLLSRFLPVWLVAGDYCCFAMCYCLFSRRISHKFIMNNNRIDIFQRFFFELLFSQMLMAIDGSKYVKLYFRRILMYDCQWEIMKCAWWSVWTHTHTNRGKWKQKTYKNGTISSSRHATTKKCSEWCVDGTMTNEIFLLNLYEVWMCACIQDWKSDVLAHWKKNNCKLSSAE